MKSLILTSLALSSLVVFSSTVEAKGGCHNDPECIKDRIQFFRAPSIEADYEPKLTQTWVKLDENAWFGFGTESATSSTCHVKFKVSGKTLEAKDDGWSTPWIVVESGQQYYAARCNAGWVYLQGKSK